MKIYVIKNKRVKNTFLVRIHLIVNQKLILFHFQYYHHHFRQRRFYHRPLLIRCCQDCAVAVVGVVSKFVVYQMLVCSVQFAVGELGRSQISAEMFVSSNNLNQLCQRLLRATMVDSLMIYFFMSFTHNLSKLIFKRNYKVKQKNKKKNGDKKHIKLM